MVGLTMHLTLKDHIQDSITCDPNATKCKCYLHHLRDREEYMNQLLASKNIKNKSLFINRIKTLHLDLPCYNPATGSLVNERVDMLARALKTNCLPYLKILQVLLMEMGSDTFMDEEDDELQDILMDISKICRKRKILWVVISELDQEDDSEEEW